MGYNSGNEPYSGTDNNDIDYYGRYSVSITRFHILPYHKGRIMDILKIIMIFIVMTLSAVIFICNAAVFLVTLLLFVGIGLVLFTIGVIFHLIS